MSPVTSVEAQQSFEPPHVAGTPTQLDPSPPALSGLLASGSTAPSGSRTSPSGPRTSPSGPRISPSGPRLGPSSLPGSAVPSPSSEHAATARNAHAESTTPNAR